MSKVIIDIKAIARQLGKKPTRDEYLELGNCSRYEVDKNHGSYTQALLQAGFGFHSQQANKEVNQVVQADFKKEVRDKCAEEILPYVGKYKKPHKNIITLVVGSDFHSHYVDMFCMKVFIDTCKRMQPDYIVFNGDVTDFYEISSFSKDPSRRLTMQKELDFVENKMFKPVREACPNSEIDFILGNHEWRLFKYLCTKAPELADLRCLQFNELFKLDKYEINLVVKPNFLSAKKEGDLKNFKIYGDTYIVTHGTKTSKHCAMAELAEYGKSGCSGHVHKWQKYSTRDLDGEKSWTSMGCMAKIMVGDDYVDGIGGKWGQGFQIAHIDTTAKLFLEESVHIKDGFALSSGRYYYDKKRSK